MTNPEHRGLDHREEQLLESVELYLERGRTLRRWWEKSNGRGSFAEKFELGRTFNRPDSSFGFFDSTVVDGRTMPIMGNFQEMFYDRTKSPSADRDRQATWIRDQLRRFVLRYFMRVSDFREPEAYVSGDRPNPPRILRPVSMCPDKGLSRIGFGFTQLYYKLRTNNEIGRFSAAEKFEIIDLRELETKYEWIVVAVDIFDFSFVFAPFGKQGPSLSLPLSESSFLVLSSDFIRNQDDPRPGELGHYGIGYAFIKNPETGLIAYGPGEFDAAIELIDFHAFADGRIRVTMSFVTNRPQKIVNISLDPFKWGFRAADLASFGMASRLAAPMRDAAAQLTPPGFGVDPVYTSIDLLNFFTAGFSRRQLCIARETLEHEFLLKHFMQHYQTVSGSLQTWRQIPDWLDDDALPSWVKTGTSA